MIVSIYKMLRTSILDLSPEIIEIIFDKLDLRSQINLKLTSGAFACYHLTNFWDLSGAIKSHQITQEILENYPFIKRLNLRNNQLVLNIDFLTKIEKINIAGSRISCPEKFVNMKEIHTVKKTSTSCTHY